MASWVGTFVRVVFGLAPCPLASWFPWISAFGLCSGADQGLRVGQVRHELVHAAQVAIS